MENKRPGETSQRRPPVPRPPPPNTRPRSYPPQTTQSRPYPPPPRAYPPPHITRPQTPQPSPIRRPSQASPARRPERTPQVRKSPQASHGLPSPQASPSRTAQPRKVSAPPRKAKPEPRFRDVLWLATPDAPAINRLAFLCALLYALIHILCGVLLVYPLNVLTARMPFPLADIVRALLPALIGATLCALTRFPMQLENRVGLSAYRKLLRAVLTLLVAVTLLMWGEWGALRQVARFVMMFVLGPLAAGTGLSVLLLYLDWLYDLEEDEDA